MRVRLGLYEIDPKAGKLRCGDGTSVLQSQPHKILLMLVERPGEIVTRDEIQRQLWPDGTIVNYEVSINQAISKLRHALRCKPKIR
jgi:cholera toxin transcriptional activator